MNYELEAILSVDTTKESKDSFHRYLGRTMGVSKATGKTIEKAYYSARDTLAEMIQIIEKQEAK